MSLHHNCISRPQRCKGIFVFKPDSKPIFFSVPSNLSRPTGSPGRWVFILSDFVDLQSNNSYSVELLRRRSRCPSPSGWKNRFLEELSLFTSRKKLRNLKLHTVCEEVKCPHLGECWSGGKLRQQRSRLWSWVILVLAAAGVFHFCFLTTWNEMNYNLEITSLVPFSFICFLGILFLFNR